MYGAGRGGATEEEEQQALQLQQHVARQRHQRERTPPARGESEASSAVDMEDLQKRWQALQRSPPSRRRRLDQEEDHTQNAGKTASNVSLQISVLFKRKVASDIVYLTWLPESRVARQVHRDRSEDDGDDGRPVFPEPPQPLPLPSPSGIDLGDSFI